ncbi:DEP domain-containing protein 1B [Orchesella cincta]|uniref:DEP domain-containing protein 1B n=1 Tax=Orchesella cincta TaxID=48709 RepID=A0A1D2N4D1_ORCCI|nr:DEP domain-containing protein 1B [Orchesella cincta]
MARPNSRTSSEVCHVNYPGFENDVFKLITDYFTSYNGCPLLTYELYDAFITTFIRAELFDFNARLYSCKTTSTSRSRLCHQLNLPYSTTVGNRTPIPNNLATEDQYPFNASESVENLIMDILTPAAIREAARRGRGITSKIQPKRILPVSAPALEVSMNPMEDSVLKSVPEPMSAKSYNADRYRNPFFFETAFTGVNSPVTRVVSETELKSTFCTLPRKGSTVQVGPMSTPPRYVYENPGLDLSASDMIYHPKYSRILKSTDIVNVSPTPNYSFYNYSNQSDSFGSSDASFHRSLPQRSHSSANLSDAYRDRSPYIPGAGRMLGRNPQGIAAEYAKSPSKSARRTLDYYYGADACVPGLMTPEGKRMAVASFRLLTLLLPPSRRKHLQILLRFMSKVAKNEKLMLDVAMTSRALIINVFFKIILNSADVREFDELLALRIVTFMVDNDADIFAISEESELVQQVEEIISEEQITKVPAKDEITPTAPQPQQLTSSSSSSLKQIKSRSKSKIKRLSSENKENQNVKLTYCYPISVDDYEGQKLLGSGGTSQSLRTLLDGIVTDPKIDHEFRRRKLLEQFIFTPISHFKKEYPHIYREKYGNSEPELLLLNESLKEEKPKERRAFSALLKPFRKN